MANTRILFTNPSAQSRLIKMQEMLRRDWYSCQQLAAEFGTTVEPMRRHIEYLIAFGGIEVTTRHGKTRFYRCVTAKVVTFENERKEYKATPKVSDCVPFRDSLTMAFFGPRV